MGWFNDDEDGDGLTNIVEFKDLSHKDRRSGFR